MFRIFGTVTVTETGEGVPNLVVAVIGMAEPEFDLDRLRAAITEETWADRIGSVLTDTNGRFELAYRSSDFQRREEAERPDLLLMVFAPEDSRSVKEASPLRPQQRVLHVSRIPRQDAARTEACAIRLLKEQLETSNQVEWRLGGPYV